MKRRRTKQRLREAEKELAGVVEDCILSWPQATEDAKNNLRLYLGSYTRVLLAWWLRLDPSWSHDHWLDSIEELSLTVEGGNCLKADGVLWWGLMSDLGGAQTSVLFDGKYCLSRCKRRRLAYELSFGGDGEHRHFVRRGLTRG